MPAIVNPVIFKIQQVIIIILFGLLLVTGIGWTTESAKVKSLKAEITTLKAQYTVERESGSRVFAEANRVKAEKISQLIAEAKQKDILFRSKLDEAQARYNAVSRDLQRMRDKIGALNRNLSNYSRATVENYAITSSNNLAECSETTAELERLATGYSAEVDRLIAQWPRDDSATITISDKSSGVTQTYQGGVVMQGDYQTVVPDPTIKPSADSP